MANFRTTNKKQLAARVLCTLLLGTYLAGGYQPPVRAAALNVYGNTNITVDSGSFASAWGYGSEDFKVIATGFASTAFGWGTKAEALASTAWGQITSAYGGSSTAFGWNTKAMGTTSTAFGNSSEAGGYAATAFGISSKARSDYSTAFGKYTVAAGLASTAFGESTKAGQLLYGSDNTEAIIIRYYDSGIYKYKIVDASDTSKTLKDGFDSYDKAYEDSNLTTAGDYATAFGYKTKASGGAATAFGDTTEARGENATAWGLKAKAYGVNSTSLGYNTVAGGDGATAFGGGAMALGFYSTAWGYYTQAGQLLYGSDNTVAYIVDYTEGGTTKYKIVDYNNPETTLKGGFSSYWEAYKECNVKDAVQATAWGAGTKALAGNATAFGNGSIASGIRSTAFGWFTEASGEGSTTWGIDSVASGNGATAWGGYTAGMNQVKGGTASGDASTAFGVETIANTKGSTAWGDQTLAGKATIGGTEYSGTYATAFGYGTKASGTYATAFGSLTTASGPVATAWGVGTKASGNRSTAFGDDTTASGFAATAWGTFAIASGKASTAFGDSSQAMAENSLAALGGIVEKDATNSAAIGKGAKVTVADAVALGSGSVADTANTISVGSSSLQRKIVNVAAGTADTDAVNLKQLSDKLDKTEFNTYKEETAATISTMNGAIVALDGRVTAAENAIPVIQQDISDLQAGKLDKTEFNTYKAETAVTISTMNGAIAGLDGRVTAAENAIPVIQQDISDLQAGKLDKAVYEADKADTKAALDGKANVALDNIKEDGKTVIKDLAKGAVNVVGEGPVSVAKSDVSGVDTYKVSVKTDGKVVSGDKGIVTGGTVYEALQAVSADTSAAIGTIAEDGNYIKKSATNNVSENLIVLDGQAKTNADAIAANAADISNLDSRVTTNEGNIATNTANISTNTTNIANLDNRVTQNETDISALEGRVTVNEGNIAANTADITKINDALYGDTIAIGKDSEATGTHSIAVGFGNKVSGKNSGAFGDPSEVTGEGSYAFGNNNKVSGNKTFVLGNDVTADVDNAVVLGDGSTAEADAVSVGSDGGERQIKHVKDGEDDTDAATVGQLKALAGGAGAGLDEVTRRISNVDSKVNKVGAGAAALAALHPMDTDGKFSMAAGFGNYRDANAMALGLFYRPNDRVMFSMGGSLGNGENLLNVGVSFALDKGVTTSKAAMARKINALEEQNSAILEENKAIRAENAKLAERLAAIEAKLGK